MLNAIGNNYRFLYKITSFVWLILIAITIVACTPEAGPAIPTPDSDEFIFGVVLVGSHTDKGWSEAHYKGGLYVEANLPDSRMISFDNLNPDAKPNMNLEKVVDDMVEQNARLIFITSDDFSADTQIVAQKHPDTTFIHVSGDHVLKGNAPPNLGNYMGRMEYGKMIAGCAAALVTETGTVGYLGPLNNHETRRLANSAFLGARYCFEHFRDQDPDDLHFIIKWIGFWFHIPEVTLDPTLVANNMLEQSVDVILSGIDTTEAMTVVNERASSTEKVWVIPYDFEDACSQAPDVCLGVPYFNWGPGYLEIAEEVSEGNWTSRWDWVGPDWTDINNAQTSIIGFRKGLALTREQSNQLDEVVEMLADGSLNLFNGPLNFQNGDVFLKEKETASDEQIWFTPQLLEGMEGLSE